MVVVGAEPHIRAAAAVLTGPVPNRDAETPPLLAVPTLVPTAQASFVARDRAAPRRPLQVTAGLRQGRAGRLPAATRPYIESLIRPIALPSGSLNTARVTVLG